MPYRAVGVRALDESVPLLYTSGLTILVPRCPHLLQVNVNSARRRGIGSCTWLSLSPPSAFAAAAAAEPVDSSSSPTPSTLVSAVQVTIRCALHARSLANANTARPPRAETLFQDDNDVRVARGARLALTLTRAMHGIDDGSVYLLICVTRHSAAPQRPISSVSASLCAVRNQGKSRFGHHSRVSSRDLRPGFDEVLFSPCSCRDRKRCLFVVRTDQRSWSRTSHSPTFSLNGLGLRHR